MTANSKNIYVDSDKILEFRDEDTGEQILWNLGKEAQQLDGKNYTLKGRKDIFS